MNFDDISNLRLINQQIVETKFKTPKDIVGWMGAMQAQDIQMAKWAIGVRLPNSTEKVIESAIDNAEIIRTHVLRPTWHFVSSEDIYWMLDLTSSRIKASMKSRDKELGLIENIYNKSNSLLEKLLRDGNNLLRQEIVSEFQNAGIAVDNNRASHLLMRAELEGIICSGKAKAKKQTYGLLTERVTKTKTLNHDEALAELATRYFTSHGPATLQDFVWWSGLSVGEARQSLEMIKSKFIPETIDNQTYWVTNTFLGSKLKKNFICFLPAFDEFIISYKNRTASLIFENHNKAVSNNGIFRPIIVKNGTVIGIWKRTIKKDNVILESEFFYPPSQAVQNIISKSFTPFEHFINKTRKY